MASERGRGQTVCSNVCGVRTAKRCKPHQQKGMERPAEERESRVREDVEHRAVSRVLPDTRNPVGKWGDHPPNLNTTQ